MTASVSASTAEVHSQIGLTSREPGQVVDGQADQRARDDR
jgi:hypothetical protein